MHHLNIEPLIDIMKKTIVWIGLFCLLQWSLHARRTLMVGVGEVCSPVSLSAPRTYIDALLEAGHLPVLIPATDNTHLLKEYVQKIDILLLPGGEDVDPAYYNTPPSPYLGEVNGRRDTFEMALLREAVVQRKPIVGICRGLQIINVYFGGTLYQDLQSEIGATGHKCPKSLSHSTHTIQIDKNSRLYQLLGTDTLGVNSNHHQAIKNIAPKLRAVAHTPDGVIEAIEGIAYPVTAVQFHPERLIRGDVPKLKILFSQLNKWAKNKK